MAERWTDSAMGQLAAALNEAKRRSHAAVEPEHLFWADLQESNGLVATTVHAGRISLAAVKSLVDHRLNQLPVVADGARAKPRFSDRLKQLITDARQVAGREPDAPLDWPSTIAGLVARNDDPLVTDLRDAGFDTAKL